MINRKTHLTTYHTLIFWVIFILVICIITTLDGHKHTVTIDYISGALHWLDGTNMYNGKGSVFIYFPQAAIFYIPFAKLPFPLSEVLWRILSLSVLAYAIFRFSKLNEIKQNALFFFIISIATAMIGFDTARNGQFNLVVVDLMLLAAAEILNKRWWLIAFYLVAGFALKPTMIVMLLLTMAFFRPLWWRVPILTLVAILIPFLFQSPHYVIGQYSQVISMLRTTADVGVSETHWAQVFGLISQTGYIVLAKSQFIIRIIMMFGTLLLAVLCKYKLDIKKFSVVLFTLAALYLMLFNPRTENNDYIILAPAIGFALAAAIASKKTWETIYISAIIIGLIGSYYLSKLFIPGHKAWVAPLMGVLFAIYYIYSVTRSLLKTTNARHPLRRQRI